MSGLVDVSSLPYPAKDDEGLLAQPASPKFRTALIEIYVPSHPKGDSDKITSGHCFDSIPIANAFIKLGMSCQLVFYSPDEHEQFFNILPQFDAIIVRCNPGQIGAAGGDQGLFDEDMKKLAKKIPVWPTADAMTRMGTKDALCHIKGMDFGLEDTLGYYSPEDINDGFKKAIAFQPRVMKQNRGSAGEGIWIIKLKSGNYCKNYGDRIASDDDILILKEASDNNVEEHTVGEFIEFCVNGRTQKSGKWVSNSIGKYFEGGVAAGGQMVDQRFLPRIDEGEARFLMVGMEVFRIEHYVYVGGVGGKTNTTIYQPDDPKYLDITRKLESDVPQYMKCLGLSMSDLLLLWAADLISIDSHKAPLVIGEFNCSCLGIAGYLNARGKDLASVSQADRDMGDGMCNAFAQKALKALQRWPMKIGSLTNMATNNDGLLDRLREFLVGSFRKSTEKKIMEKTKREMKTKKKTKKQRKKQRT